jgi:hypothetical protein
MIFKIILDIFIIALFIYTKLLPHQDKIEGKYKRIFTFFNSIFNPILSFFKKYIKPIPVGPRLSVDTSQVVLLFILLIFS